MKQHVEISSDIVSAKLPHEEQHLQALQRMRTLDGYYDWSIGLLRPWIGKRVLDAGCGIGNGTQHCAGLADYVLAADLSLENLKEVRQRFSDQTNVETIQLDLDTDFTHLADRNFDTIICLDVLEHLEDDARLLRRFHDISAAGAYLLVKVPACRWLFGGMDKASAHYRRYSKKLLGKKLTAAGWSPVKLSYMNIAGVLPYFIKSRVLKRDTHFSRTFTPAALKRIHSLIPWLRRLDRLIGPPVGQSLIASAVRSGK